MESVEKISMRHEWFNWVSKTRKKLSKGKNTCSHREAMSHASATWPAEKAKLVKKRAREQRKLAKLKLKEIKTT